MPNLSDILRARQSGGTGLTGLSGLSGLRGLGGRSQQRDADIQAHLPVQEEITEAREEMQEEEPNLFFKILQIPDRLFFGQSIKGALKGAGEEGALGAVGGFVRNNPLFQILDILPGVDIVDDTDFAEVREAFGDDDAREGIGNLLLNIAGEIATDPSSFLMPFGKVSAIGKTAKPSAKMLSGAVGAKDIMKMGLLEEAVETGTRAMLTFKVPFMKAEMPLAGWFVKPFKSFDVPVARHLEKWADWLNTSPFMKPFAKAFRGERSRFGPTLDSETGEVIVSGSRVRGDVRKKWLEKEAAESKYMSRFLPMIGSIIHRHGDLLKDDKEVQQFIFMATELGIDRVDDATQVAKIVASGVPHAKAKAARDRLLGIRWFEGKPADQFAEELAERMATEGTDAVRAVEEWLERYPNAKLPDAGVEIAKDMGIARKVTDLGEDLRRLEPGVDYDIVETVGAATKGSVERRAAAGLSGEVERGREILDRVGKEQNALYESVTARADITKDELFDVIEAGRNLMEEVGAADVASGILGTVSELYIPRVLSPAAKELMNSQFMRFTAGAGKDALKFVEGFTKGRKFTDLSTLEVLALTREMGTKFTSFRPLRRLGGKAKSDGVLDKIFDNKFLRVLKKADPDAAELFLTNPANAWYRRLEQSSRVHGKLAFARSVFGQGDELSPMVLHSDPLGTLDPALIETRANMRPFLVLDDGRILDVSERNAGQLTSIGMHNEVQARVSIARGQVNDWSADQIVTRKVSDGEVVKSLQDDLKMARMNRKDLDAYSPQTGTTGANLKKALKEREQIGKDLAALRAELLRGKQARGGRGVRGLVDEDQIQQQIDELGYADEAAAVSAEVKAGTAKPTSYSRAYDKIEELKKALRDEASEIRSVRDDFIKGIKGETKDKQLRLTEIVNRKMNAGEFQDELALHMLHRRNGHVALDEIARDHPELFERMKKRYKGATVKWLDNEVADNLYGKDGLWARLHKRDELGLSGIMKTFDAATWFWKAWTVLPPMFLQTRMRDWVSNMVLYAQSGISPTRLMADAGEGMRISRAVGKSLRGDTKALESVILKRTLADGTEETMTAADMLGQAQAGGLINSGWVRDELVRNGEDYVSFASGMKGKFLKNLFRLNPADNSMIRAGFRVAEFGDNHSKLTALISRWKMGEAIPDALTNVKKWAYDPSIGSGLTSFERHAARRLIPFYSFAKFAIQTEVAAYFTRPGTVTFWEKVHSASKGGANLTPEEADLMVPEYIKDNFGIPYKEDKEGNPRFFMFGGYFAISELAKVADAVGETFSAKGEGSILDALGERLNPFLKTPLENVINRSFYTQREVERFPGETDEIFGWTVSKKTRNYVRSIRFLNEVDRLNILNFSDIERIVRLSGNAVERGEARKGGVGPTEEFLSSSFGILPKLRSVDLEQQEKFRQAKINTERSRLKGLLRKRVMDTDKAGREEDITSLRRLLAENAARDEVREQVEERVERRSK